MVDPQTVNKFLNQPLRGSDVGVWDTPVNANMGIIDNSFGGVATVPLVNTPITLSPSQYQCVFIVFTGALSANVAVTFPGIGSFYTVQNLTSNTSAFTVTALTTAAGSQSIGLPPGEPCEILTDGTNPKYRNFGRVGTYWDYAGSSVPAWVSACTVPPYLNCDGTAFSSATYPILATILGGTTLPDARGRFRATLNQTTGRITSGSSTGGVDGNTLLTGGGSQTSTLSSQNIPPVPYVDPGHTHAYDRPITGSAGPVGGGLGGFSTSVVGTNTVGITIGSTSPTNFSIIPPVYIGGITMVRSA